MTPLKTPALRADSMCLTGVSGLRPSIADRAQLIVNSVQVKADLCAHDQDAVR
jgi:hypothetical protein